jgi:pimeloyl-ACP methyl ester carboxylesterase
MSPTDDPGGLWRNAAASTWWRLAGDGLVIGLATLAVHFARGAELSRMRGGRVRYELLFLDLVAGLVAWGLLRGWGLVIHGVWRFRPDAHWSLRLGRTIVVRGGQTVIAFTLLLTLLQLHPPRLRSELTPERMGLKAERFTVTTADGYRLAGLHVPASKPDRPAVLIGHGLGASKEDFLGAVRIAARWDCHVAIVDFRGHGESEGTCCTLGVLERKDLIAARAWLAEKHPGCRIVGIGYSMGGAAMLGAAAEAGGFDRLVIDGTFRSAERMGRDRVLAGVGPLKHPLWWLGRAWGGLLTGIDIAAARPIDDVARIQAPILFVHGTADRTIPAAESRALSAARPGSELWLIEGADHLETMRDPGYSARLRRFLLDE